MKARLANTHIITKKHWPTTKTKTPIFVSKGAFFIAKAGDILDQRKRLPEPLLFFSLDHVQSVEIDNFEDLEFAKLLKEEL